MRTNEPGNNKSAICTQAAKNYILDKRLLGQYVLLSASGGTLKILSAETWHPVKTALIIG